MRRAALGVGLLAGCGGFGGREARVAFSGLNAVITDVAGQVDAAVVAGGSDELVVEGGDAAWTVDGALSAGTYWSGPVAVAGDVAGDGRDAALALRLDEVEIPADRVTLSGDVALDVARDLPTDDAPESWRIVYGLTGDLSARGRARGAGEVDYAIEVEVEGDAVTFAAVGTIGGRDVAGFVDDWGGEVAR